MKPVIVFTAFVFALLTIDAWPASPVGKTHTNSDYTQDCGNGKRGVKCSNYQTASFNYNIPTLREDGSELTPSEISHYVVQFEKDAGPTVQFSVPNTLTFQLPKMPSGSYVFRIATVDTSGQRGAFSPDTPLVIQ